MLKYVFRPAGRRVFRGRFRVGNERKIYDVSLYTDKKHIAQAKLNLIVTEKEAEMCGLLAPRSLRDGAQKSIVAHLQDYAADLAAKGCTRKHVSVARNRITRLCEQCGWSRLVDISSDKFNAWRAKQKLAAKTCNEYLTLASAFLNWMERNERTAFNPLRRVTKSETRGKEVRKRRALSQAEVDLLVSRSGKRGLPYFLAAYTGLRRREIQQLMWSDVHLDVPKPYLEVRASTTKNKKSALIPLVPALAEGLRERFPKKALKPGKVFRTGIPTAKTLRVDLKACGITPEDDLGRVVDFHALRYTFASMLAKAGVAPRVTMELMRHSDMRLTQNTYTDATLLPLFSEVEKLSNPPAPAPSCSLIGSQNSAKTGVFEGFPVQTGPEKSEARKVANSDVGGSLTSNVQAWPNFEVAERVGFEPTLGFPKPHFECGAFNHSATSPGVDRRT